jgi:hypothetical protein
VVINISLIILSLLLFLKSKLNMKKSRSRKIQRAIKSEIQNYKLIVKSVNQTNSGSSTLEAHPKVDSDIEDLSRSFSSLSINSDISSNSFTDFEESVIKSPEEEFKEDLIKWTIDHNIDHNSLSDLLKIVKRLDCLKNLPSDARTLLKTPRSTEIQLIPPGKYLEFNWCNSLSLLIKKQPEARNPVKVQINIDGIPLFKSSNQQFWPILGSIESTQDCFVIGIFAGAGKPNSVNQFLDKFVNKFNDISEAGLVVNGQTYLIQISAILCDAPARSFILGAKNHTGYSSCGKCDIKGEYFMNRVIFPFSETNKRTDQSFRNQDDKRHHNEVTIINNLPINLVKDVPFEYLHLVCLGVVRKLLHLWTKGKKCPARLRPHEIELISTKLKSLKSSVPVEFARKPRSLKELENWKGTEFRQFVLYSGPIVLKSVLSQELYEHFICFHVAITILVNPKLCKTLNSYAENLLKYFVQTFAQHYGKETLSYNVHGLLHLAEDCSVHGNLDNFSTFKFENKLQEIKKLIRSSNNPLQQAHRRIIEREHLEEEECASKTDAEFLVEWEGSPNWNNLTSTDAKQFKKYKIANSLLSATFPNNVCQLSDGSVVKIRSFFVNKKDSGFIGQKFKQEENLYKLPSHSKNFNIKLVSNLDEFKKFSIELISNKCILFPFDNKFCSFLLPNLKN